MKRLSSKKGFTLVECVVAMAVLAIMTIGLLMILSVTVKTRNSNLANEREIDRQVEELVYEKDVSTGIYDKPIVFTDNDGNPVASISESGQIINVNNDDEDTDISIGKIKYEFEGGSTIYIDTGDGNDNSGNSGENINYQTGNYKVYGAADINGTVNIDQVSIDTSTDTYQVTWKISFSVNSVADSQGVKIVFPTGSSNITYNSWEVTGCEIVKMDKYTERLCIKGSYAYPAYVSATFLFKISAENYEKYVGSVKQYFMNTASGDGTDNSAKVEINHDYTQDENS